jgi:hypothetical protein
MSPQKNARKRLPWATWRPRVDANGHFEHPKCVGPLDALRQKKEATGIQFQEWKLPASHHYFISNTMANRP